MDITCEDVKKFIEKIYEINLSRRDRKRFYINARNIYYLFCYKYATGATYETIGGVVGRSHASVLNGLNNIRWELSSGIPMYKKSVRDYHVLENEFLSKMKIKSDPTLEDRVFQLEQQLKEIKNVISA